MQTLKQFRIQSRHPPTKLKMKNGREENKLLKKHGKFEKKTEKVHILG
jgi:hypothetical protein